MKVKLKPFISALFPMGLLAWLASGLRLDCISPRQTGNSDGRHALSKDATGVHGEVCLMIRPVGSLATQFLKHHGVHLNGHLPEPCVPACARPFPILRLGDQPAPYGIAVKILNHRPQRRSSRDIAVVTTAGLPKPVTHPAPREPSAAPDTSDHSVSRVGDSHTQHRKVGQGD